MDRPHDVHPFYLNALMTQVPSQSAVAEAISEAKTAIINIFPRGGTPNSVKTDLSGTKLNGLKYFSGGFRKKAFGEILHHGCDKQAAVAED